MHTFLLIFCGFCSWPAGFDLWCDGAFSLTSFETYSAFIFVAAKQPLTEVLGSYAGVFRGARLLSLTTNACSTKNNISFPNLANHIVLSKLWKPLGYPIITRSAWNTGKALWPLLNVRLTIAKVIFGQILEYSVHCITLAKEKKKENGNSRVTFLSCLACQHFISQLVIGHLPRKWNNGKGMLSSVEQAFVGRDEKRAPLKTTAWESRFLIVLLYFDD